MYVCNIYESGISLHVHMFGGMYRGQRKMLCILFYHFLHYSPETGSPIELGATLAASEPQQSPCLCSTSVLVIVMCGHAQLLHDH